MPDDQALPALLRLPPELRLMIYAYLFTVQLTTEIDLRQAGTVPDALLRTCRQIYAKTCRIYHEYYHKYWNSSRFFLKIQSFTKFSESVRTDLAYLKDSDLKHITSLRIKIDRSALASDRITVVTVNLDLMDQRAGAWRRTAFESDSIGGMSHGSYLLLRLRPGFDREILRAWASWGGWGNEDNPPSFFPRSPKVASLREQISRVVRNG